MTSTEKTNAEKYAAHVQHAAAAFKAARRKELEDIGYFGMPAEVQRAMFLEMSYQTRGLQGGGVPRPSNEDRMLAHLDFSGFNFIGD